MFSPYGYKVSSTLICGFSNSTPASLPKLAKGPGTSSFGLPFAYWLRSSVVSVFSSLRTTLGPVKYFVLSFLLRFVESPFGLETNGFGLITAT